MRGVLVSENDTFSERLESDCKLEQEIWKDVKGYEGRYKVSNYGRVASIPRYVSNHTGELLVKPRILKQGHSHKGYPIVYLSKNAEQKTIVVHRLVALAFIENSDKKPQVNHVDGNKQNNHADNLEWCTNGENQLHAYKMGLSKHSEKSGRKRRAVNQISRKTGEVVSKYSSISEAAQKINAPNTSNIGECCRGRKKSAYGFLWEYANEGGEA